MSPTSPIHFDGPDFPPIPPCSDRTADRRVRSISMDRAIPKMPYCYDLTAAHRIRSISMDRTSSQIPPCSDSRFIYPTDITHGNTINYSDLIFYNVVCDSPIFSYSTMHSHPLPSHSQFSPNFGHSTTPTKVRGSVNAYLKSNIRTVIQALQFSNVKVTPNQP